MGRCLDRSVLRYLLRIGCLGVYAVTWFATHYRDRESKERFVIIWNLETPNDEINETLSDWMWGEADLSADGAAAIRSVITEIQQGAKNDSRKRND